MNINLDPQSISDFVFKSPREQLLVQSIVDGRRPFPQSGKNGILLYGTWGTGKSALAKLLPSAIEAGKGSELLYSKHYKIQAGGNNGVNILAAIGNNSNVISSNDSGYHYFVLDEVDRLSDVAMSSLKVLMDKRETIFVMATNSIDKIDGGVKSRCHLVEFNAAPSAAWLPLAHRILAKYGVDNAQIDAELIAAIDCCNGSAREVVDLCIEIAINRQMKIAA
ncbi:AAA family ATPase [Undibacterium sp. Dicai25W]|uniref:AAA family ATPase n=1 Tax=Undibacterium sp. Dicai25W TaxID=3413034 RepID=UPI003BF25C32